MNDYLSVLKIAFKNQATFLDTSGKCIVKVGVAPNKVYRTAQSPAGR